MVVNLKENKRVLCDGCRGLSNSISLSFRRAEGREVRYCADCDAEYARWLAVLQAEETRLNTLLDIFIDETRDKLNLILVPQDLLPTKGLGTLG